MKSTFPFHRRQSETIQQLHTQSWKLIKWLRIETELEQRQGFYSQSSLSSLKILLLTTDL